MEHHWNAKPAVLDEESLNGVRQLRLAARILAAAGVARTADLPEAMTVAERRARFLEIEIAGRVKERAGLVVPHAHHLRGFLLERHPREEILDALRRRCVGIAIRQRSMAPRSHPSVRLGDCVTFFTEEQALTADEKRQYPGFCGYFGPEITPSICDCGIGRRAC